MKSVGTSAAEQDIVVGIIVAIVVLLIILLALAIRPKRRQYPPRWRDSYSPWGRFQTPFNVLHFGRDQRPDLTDAGQQLNAVMAGSFERRRILGSSEYRVFTIVEAEIAAQRAGYRVFAQTSLGEILKSDSDDAFRSINSKRVDILVVDRGGWPLLAVEYQGDSHYQGTAAARDAVKKEALRKAGVRYLEFSPTDTDDQIRSRLREYLTQRSS